MPPARPVGYGSAVNRLDGDNAFAGEGEALGRSIRVRRTELGLTTAKLAAAAGVSRSLISQVERGLTSPSITTLRRIAAALGVPVVALFAGEAAGSGSFDRHGVRLITRSYERRGLYRSGSASGDVIYELLTPDLDRQIEFMRVEVAPRASTHGMSVHVGEENQFCLEGSYVFIIDGEEFAVNEGDSISFDASKPHRVENRTDARAVLISAITPPNF